MPVDPRELTLLVTGTANALYDSLPAEDLAVLAAVLTSWEILWPHWLSSGSG